MEWNSLAARHLWSELESKEGPRASYIGGGSLNGYGSVLSADGKTLFVADANSDGLIHFRSFGSGVIGLEDLKGGGNQDFEDLILSYDFQLKSV